MKRLLLMMFVFLVFLTACGEKIETNMSQDVKDFNFTTQDNEKLSRDDLEGKWWVADFVFTNCTTVCLPMTTNMSHLQDKMKEEDLDAQLVSFSIDPEHDTPEVLKDFAEGYQADFSNWSFLTGYDFQTIKKFSIKSFKSLVEMPTEESDQFMHGTSFFLVNPEGEVIKRYTGTDAKDMDEIIADLKLVLD